MNKKYRCPLCGGTVVWQLIDDSDEDHAQHRCKDCGRWYFVKNGKITFKQEL